MCRVGVLGWGFLWGKGGLGEEMGTGFDGGVALYFLRAGGPLFAFILGFPRDSTSCAKAKSCIPVPSSRLTSEVHHHPNNYPLQILQLQPPFIIFRDAGPLAFGQCCTRDGLSHENIDVGAHNL